MIADNSGPWTVASETRPWKSNPGRGPSTTATRARASLSCTASASLESNRLIGNTTPAAVAAMKAATPSGIAGISSATASDGSEA